MPRIAASSGLTLLLSLLFFSIAPAACSSDDATPAPAADAGVDPSLVDFTVFVAEPAIEGPWTGISGISGFIDPASGARVEATSEASGRMVFKGVSFKDGPATVTVYASGRVFASVSGLTPEAVAKSPLLPLKEFPAGEKNFLFPMPKLGPPSDAVKLSGNILGKFDPGNNVSLSTSPSRGAFQDKSGTYSLDVKKGVPLTAVAMEWNGQVNGANSYEEAKLRFVKFDIPARDADGALDLDLDKGTPLTSTKLTVTLKHSATDTLGIPVPGWQVQTMSSILFFLGSRSRVSLVGGGTYKAEGEFVPPPVPSEIPLTFVYFPGRGGDFAAVQKGGLPVDGETFEAPAYPKGPTDTIALGGEVPITNVFAGAEGLGVDVTDNTIEGNSAQVWTVQTLKGTALPAKIVLPNLPDAARALLPSALNARPVVFGGSADDAHPLIPRNIALGKYFKVTK